MKRRRSVPVIGAQSGKVGRAVPPSPRLGTWQTLFETKGVQK